MVGTDNDLVVDTGMKGGDKMWGVVVEVLGMGNVSEEVLVHKFFLWAPDLFSTFVEDRVEVRVLLSSLNTRRRSKEVREESKVDVVGFIDNRRRLYSGCSDGGWAPNDIFG